MTDGQQEAEWSHTMALVLGFGKVMSGRGPKLLDLIPARYRSDEATLTDEQDEAAADLAFAELESGLKAMGQNRQE